MAYPEYEIIGESIQREMTEKSIPSLAVAAARDGEITWEKAFGWSNRELRVPATVHTPYSLASISKPITTTGLMILAERGLLDLDAPINNYLGSAKIKAVFGDADKATIRSIANHTSGLPLHYQFFYADEPYSRPSMDETIRRYGNLVRAPGERVQYSNLGFGILDYLIVRLSEKSYRDFMREEVFQPLGMFQSSVDLTPQLEANQAVRYGADGVPYPFYDFDHPGGSAIYASAHDLVRFGLLHAGCLMSDMRQILKPETLVAMRTPVNGPDEPYLFGVGWRCEVDTDGVQVISHSGGMGGVSTALLIAPEQHVSVTALANFGCNLPHRVAEEMLAYLLPDVGKRRSEARERRKEEEAAKPPYKWEPVEEIIGEWIGTVQVYDRELPLTITVKPYGDVHVKLDNQLTALVNEPKFRDGNFVGIFVGDLDVEDVNRRPHRLHLDLKWRGEEMTGCAIAVTHIERGEGGASGRRMGNALSFPCRLQR